jgi:hypothetical protein
MKHILYFVLAVLLLGVLPKHVNAVEELPDFFICNYWEDSNGDGLLDDDEYVGVKTTFDTDTDSIITFVGYFYNQKGKEIGLKLYEPDGTLYSDRTSTAEYEPTHVHRWWYHVSTLADEAAGDWTAKWYLEGELQATKTFTIIKSDDDYSWVDDWLDYLSEDENEEPDFFTCNQWVDKNGDGLLDRDEYVGIKKTFYVETDTTITFVSYWRDQKDSKIEIKIFDPTNEIWYDDTSTVEFEPTHVHRWWFDVKTMAQEGGVGDWVAKLYLNVTFHTSLTLRIDKLYSTTKLNPQFFTCLKWVDKNDDNKIASDYSEFVGIKDEFDSKKDTDIYFFSHWVMKKGRMRKMKIYSPKGDLWKTVSLILTSDDTYWHPSYTVSAIVKEGGKGNWKVVWYLDDKEVFEKTFTIK